MKAFIGALAVLTALIHIGQFTFWPMESIRFFAWHLMLGLVMVFLFKPLHKTLLSARIVDGALVALSILVGVSVIVNYDSFSTMMQNNRLSPYFFVLGVASALLAVEAARRVIGWFLPVVSLITVLYALFGGNLPGILGHRGYNVQRVVITIFSDQGIYGTPIGVSASNVYLFLLFGGFLGASGADRVFQNIAISLTGRRRGGPAKIAVVGSGLFGSISGSAVANVVSTGTFTIPLMKRQGYSGVFAGAVEAVASTGGQFMPPIMGAAAFVLSDIAGQPYAAVCLAALLPALMYYLTVFKMVDLEAVKHGLCGLPSEQLPNLRATLKVSVKLFVPLGVLLFSLLVSHATPMLAAIYAMASLVLCGLLDRSDRLTPARVLAGCVAGCRALPQVVAACACSGIVVGMFALTGLGLKFSDFIMRAGEAHILISLALAMVICIILGTGLPTTAAYIICATAIAPALIKSGIGALSAHLFLLYFASISAITPPVAVASYAAASIAGENALAVGLHAVKLGVAGFALPFTFALNHDYLHFGFDLLTLFTWVSAFVVCYSTAIAIQGQVEQRITLAERLLYCVVIVLAIQSNFALSLAGWLVFAVLFYGRVLQSKRASLKSVETPAITSIRRRIP